MEDPGSYEALLVGESCGRRVTHTPSRATHASLHGGQLSEKDESDDACELGCRFLPPVDRSATDESTGGDISLTRVVARKVHRRWRRIPMLFAMKVEWPERDPTTRWVVEIEDTTKP